MIKIANSWLYICTAIMFPSFFKKKNNNKRKNYIKKKINKYLGRYWVRRQGRHTMNGVRVGKGGLGWEGCI